MGQDRGGRDDRGSREDRGGREERGSREDRGRSEDRGGGDSRRFDPTEILKRMDQNGNGQLEPEEVSDRGRRFIGEMASRAGLDANQPLPIDKLVAAATGESNEDSAKPPSDNSSSSSKTKAESPPLVPGFGVATTGQIPPGFDVPLDKAGRFKRPLEERFEKAVLDRVDDMLRQYDENKDGKIDLLGEEGKRARWQNDPKASDLNSDGKLDREELCYRIAKIMGSRERTEDDRGSSSRGKDDSSEARAKVRRYAEGMLRQYDENKNGVLEKDEWSKMRGEPGKADLDRDGTITLDELTDRVGNYASDSSSSSSNNSSTTSSDSSRSRSPWGSRSRGETSSRDSADTKGGRFLTPTERLPKGLPTWFARNDADGDGQVKMAEYSTSWNDTTVAEFARYDLNGDGVITPEECLLGEKNKLAKK